MEQFDIKRLLDFRIGPIDASYTNSALWMTIAVVLATFVFVVGMRQRAMVPGRLQAVAELGYEFVANMVRDNVGSAGKKYFPFIVTFAMALFVFLGVTIIGFARHGAHFVSFFVPKGVPFVLLLLLVPIEIISYFVRPFSLSIRLFANMLAGHTMLKVFGGFVVMLGIYAGWAPLAFIVVFTGLELLIAFLQAYVFAILTCLYLNDAIHMSH
jgi:F-type H+-transporting ATPase subunit a